MSYRKVRIVHSIKMRWKTRHWDRRHFPGCPVRYGQSGECMGPDFCGAARTEWT